MVSIDGGLIAILDNVDGYLGGSPVGGKALGSWDLAGVGTVRPIYKMTGQDIDALPSIIYRTWTVIDLPDFNATYYTGPRSGITPFANVSALLLNKYL